MTRCRNCGGINTERVEATLEGGIRKRRWACSDCQHDFLVRFERIDVEVREESTRCSGAINSPPAPGLGRWTLRIRPGSARGGR